MKAFLALLFSLIASAAAAQNTTCPTRPAGDNSNACASTAFVGGQTLTVAGPVNIGSTAAWPGTFYNFMAMVNVVDPFGVGAMATASRSSDWSLAHSPCCTNILVNSSLSVHDRTTAGPTAIWGTYWQHEKTSTATDIGFLGFESSFHNLGNTNAFGDPFTPNPTGVTENIRLDSGIGTGNGNPVTAAFHILNNGGKYNSGIIIGSNSINSKTVSATSIIGAMEFPSTYNLVWYSAANTLGGAVTVDGSNIYQVTASGGINLGASGFSVSGAGVLSASNVTTAWTTYTPSPVCGSGTFTNNSARSRTMGKTTFFEFDLTVSALGTCTNGLTVTLPNTAQSSAGAIGRDAVSTGGAAVCSVAAASNSLFCSMGNNLTGTSRVVASGVYENQ